MQSRLAKLALALGLGAAGGALAFWAKLPLAWMIGAMVVTTVAAIWGAPIAVPPMLRNCFVAVLGVMLGSSFKPDLVDRLGEWAVSLAGLTVYTSLSACLGYLFLKRLGGYGRTTAYFGAMPGGLAEMILVGSAMGGDSRVISLLHASRILFVVLALPFAFQFFFGYDPSRRGSAGVPLAEIAWTDLGILAACAVAGAGLGRLARFPAWQLIGPMLLSAAVHLAGWTKASPPAELIAVSQVVIGSTIGCRFAGTHLRFVARVLVWAAMLTLLLIAVSLLCALLVHLLTGLSTPHLVLAYAPGGLAEMSLVALALAFDPSFVATHHIVRIFLVIVLAPLVYRLWVRKKGE
jgi:uncharacterized protein